MGGRALGSKNKAPPSPTASVVSEHSYYDCAEVIEVEEDHRPATRSTKKLRTIKE